MGRLMSLETSRQFALEGGKRFLEAGLLVESVSLLVAVILDRENIGKLREGRRGPPLALRQAVVVLVLVVVVVRSAAAVWHRVLVDQGLLSLYHISQPGGVGRLYTHRLRLWGTRVQIVSWLLRILSYF